MVFRGFRAIGGKKGDREEKSDEFFHQKKLENLLSEKLCLRTCEGSSTWREMIFMI